MRVVDLLKFYDVAISLKGNTTFLTQLIAQWDHHRQAFQVGLDKWFRPTREDIYFITGLSRIGEDFSYFPEVTTRVVASTQLVYVQRYVDSNNVDRTQFQVSGGKLSIASFGREDVRCLSLMVMTIAHITSDGKHIIFPLLYYVDFLMQEPR